MTSRKPYLYTAAIWLVMVAVFFSPVVFQGKLIAPLDIMDSLLRPWATMEKIQVHNAFTYDSISQYLPYDWSVFQSLRQDGFIGWNPFTHSGSSIVENTMICPGDWHHHLYRFLPFWTAWNSGIILQFTIAGLGMLLLLRDQKIPAAYALIGVVAFGFYSQFILWIQHRWILGAMCWAPWILWALFRAQKSGRIVHLPSIAFIALAFRGGHLQACVFVFLLVVIVSLSDWWKHPDKWRLSSIFQRLLPYAVSGVFGAVLALDVFIETIPPFLHGCRNLPGRSWLDTLMALPSLVTAIIPTLLGTPQGLDASRIFNLSLFDIKFAGAITLVMASLACFTRKAPLTAKFLLILGLLLPFTPADQWLYSRFTVVFAIGAAWLAAWQLTELAKQPHQTFWKYGWGALTAIVLLWTLFSVGLVWKHDWMLAKLHATVIANLEAGKASRLDWMLSRSGVFLQECKIWYPRNLAFITLIGLGFYGVTRIHAGNPKSQLFGLLVACTTFGELFLFSTTWVTFSDKPAGQGLYSEPAWVTRLKKEVGNGKVAVFTRADFDYMQLNTPSAYGIRFAEGYETITPQRIAPAPATDWNPLRFAEAGISHILVAPERDPGGIAGWEKVLQLDEFVLYKNPAFSGLVHAELASGTSIPLQSGFETPNRREFDLPAGVKTFNLLESFNPGWKYSLDGVAWKPVLETPLHAIRIDLESPTQGDSTRLQLRYQPTYQSFYRIVISTSLVTLFGFSIYRRRQPKRATGKLPLPSSAATA
jgi:hypothetical protein